MNRKSRISAAAGAVILAMMVGCGANDPAITLPETTDSVAEVSEMVRFEMTETIYDMEVFSMEEAADGQYVLSGAKYYPDIVLTDDQKAQLEQVGLLCGFIGGREFFRITEEDGTYWFAWQTGKEYEVQFVEAGFSAWEDGWVMGSKYLSNPIGWHSYGPLKEEFELTVSADQIRPDH